MTHTHTPRTIAFTGHRSYNRTHDATVLDCVESLVAEGARIFRVGMAEGFDIAAALVTLGLKSKCEDIRLELYIPYPSFSLHMSDTDRRLYNEILNRADYVEYIAKEYYTGVYQDRNKRLVEGADMVVAWWNGKPSGTGYTVSYARALGCPVKNLYDYQQLELEL